MDHYHATQVICHDLIKTCLALSPSLCVVAALLEIGMRVWIRGKGVSCRPWLNLLIMFCFYAAVIKEKVYKLRQEVEVIPGEPGDAMDTS